MTGRLVEWDADNAATAQRSLASSELDGIEVVQGDASWTDVYQDVVPTDVLLCAAWPCPVSTRCGPFAPRPSPQVYALSP